ncbi:MAG: response regulator [Spirochaetales bacterium]|nr:response regulator [Spirochaetales bacterium]
MFQKMITILLYNIFTCTGENGRIRVIVKETHTKILLHIKVHGPGITEERIKEKFLSICNLGENNIQSRGTMLFFIRHFIDSIQGKIKIKRKPDNRVIVSLIFPKGEKPGIKQIKQTTVKLPDTGMAKKLPEGSYEKEKQTVFILESNKDTIININKCMKSYYNIFHATNGEEALDKIKRIPKPDIIISNINMKKMNGYEFYHHLLKDEKFKDIPVFFLDTLTNKQEKIKAIKKGIIDVIDKPFHMEEFVEKVRSFLENRKVFIELQRKRIEEKISILLRRNGDDEFLQFEKKCILYRISPREKNILRELLRGLQTKEIAVKYYLSTHTVKKHIRMIYKKCNVQNRVELVNCFKN